MQMVISYFTNASVGAAVGSAVGSPVGTTLGDAVGAFKKQTWTVQAE